MSETTAPQTKTQFIISFQEHKSYVNVTPNHTLVNVRYLLHSSLDACQLPDEEFLFRLDGILVSSKQEGEHLAFDILKRASIVELIPASAVKKRKSVPVGSVRKKSESKCHKSSTDTAVVKEQNTSPVDQAAVLQRPSTPGIAQLTKYPRSLQRLWEEYIHGIPPNKPAKDFTFHERGANKYKYCRRNVFWKKMLELIRAGHTAEMAIDMIYQCYGHGTSTSGILNAMIRDNKTGGHPNLRVVAEK